MEEKIDLSMFNCRQCGACCKGEGFVKVTKDDCARIAKHLGISEREFRKQYTKEGVFGGLWLKDKINMDCIFLEDNKCSINDVKPDQCKKFPHEWVNPDTNSTCPEIYDILKTRKDYDNDE